MKKFNIYLILGIALLCTTSVTQAGDDKDNKDKDHGIPYPQFENYYRIDCRYHNSEHHSEVKFCYASGVYQIVDRKIRNVHLGVGCDNRTLFHDRGMVQIETTLDRFSPLRAATPGVEVFPQGQLGYEGTYTSELDIAAGRLEGLCYVKKFHNGDDK